MRKREAIGILLIILSISLLFFCFVLNFYIDDDDDEKNTREDFSENLCEKNLPEGRNFLDEKR
ncbi:MAG: hypothetical protein WC548_03025 [Candidatus Pacearchaeota archaeon]